MRAILTVIGHDKVGIIATVCTKLAETGVNVLDINQTILGDNFTMVMLVDSSAATIPFADIATLMETTGTEMGLAIRMQREDIFNAMHRI